MSARPIHYLKILHLMEQKKLGMRKTRLKPETSLSLPLK